MRTLLLACVLMSCVAAACGAECVITGDYTILCGSIVYRAVDDECVYYVDLASHNAQHPGTPLPTPAKKIADNYDPGAVPAPVVVELTDYVDCTGTTHNFQHANICSYSQHPNKPSRLMTISGKQFRVTAAPDDGFATYFYSYDVQTGGQAGVPHLLVAESSNDQERYTSIFIHHPDGIIYTPEQRWAPPYTYKPEAPSVYEPTNAPWGEPWWQTNMPATQQGTVFGCDVGVTSYTGREIPATGQPYNIALTFYAKTAGTRVVVSSLGCNRYRGPNDGGAVSQMWVFERTQAAAQSMPDLALPEDPAERRHIGIHMTHPWYLYAHYGTPVRLLSHRQENLQRMVDDLKFSGFDYLVFNAINGSDRTGKAWYPDSDYFDWNSAGDLLSELPPIAQAAGIQLVPVITSLKDPGGLTTLSYQLGTDGDYTRAFGNPTLDPLRPEVQQIVFNLLSEIAQRCATSPAVRGIGIRVNGKIGTCYTSDESGDRGAKLSGYSSWDLQQFKTDTGLAVPTSNPLTAYTWLQQQPQRWEAWINWRCQRTRSFWLACRDVVRSFRPDLLFYVQCDLPSETPGTNIEWPAETPRNLLRHHGYDPDMFAGDTGIVISRGTMVATDRFYTTGRWAAPWGSSSENYRLFHYAPGLAESYRTAEGRACEFYQNYWEEHQNPYWEFGSCGSAGVYFRTMTPAAPGRFFFEGAAMSMRRQDPDTMTWLGWYRPTLGHEADLRKFAQAFRALPAVDPVAFAGTIEPAIEQVVARWYRNRLALINDTNTPRPVTLHFAAPLPLGDELTDVVTGRKLISATQPERQHVSYSAEAYSLNTFLHTEATGPQASFTTAPLPTSHPLTVEFFDASEAAEITSWDWDFGDGSVHGSGPNPSHTYADFGTYDVTLTIATSEGPASITRPVALEPIRPTVVSVSPPAVGANIGSLSLVGVLFSEPVVGVAPGNLVVGGSAATSVIGSGAGPYWFSGFASPAPGSVSLALAAGAIADLDGLAFLGHSWDYSIQEPPVLGVDNPSFELNGGSYDGWEIAHISGEGPDNPPLDNSNQWGVDTPHGTHFGGKITNGLPMDFYLGQVIGLAGFESAAGSADWQLDALVQILCLHENQPRPTGAHIVWEIGWNDDGSEPVSMMECDNYLTAGSIDGTFTGNDKAFHSFSASGTIPYDSGSLWAGGLRAMAVRAHFYTDSGWWWTYANIDNLSFSLTPAGSLSIPAAKALADGPTVVLRNKSVTAAWANEFYVQEGDRSSGLRVQQQEHGMAPGLTVDLIGALSTNTDGERCLVAAGVAPFSTGQVDPVFLTCRDLAAGNWLFTPGGTAGQGGVYGGVGLNNIGLLVTIAGFVTAVGDGYIYIDDGTGLLDGTSTNGVPNRGVRVVCDPGIFGPPDFVVCTGISSCFDTGLGHSARRLLLRSQDDIRPVFE